MIDEGTFPEWQRFERDAADALTRLGWDAKLTQGSHDFGADILAVSGRDRLVVQCKFFANTTPLQSPVVREVMVAKEKYKAKLGLIVYRGHISKRTFEYAMAQKVAMLTLDQVMPGSFYDRTRLRSEQEDAMDQASKTPVKGETKAIVACPSCRRMNRLPLGREGIMTCGHCRNQSYHRT